MKEGFKEKFLKIFSCSSMAVIMIVGAIMVYPTYQRGLSLKLQEAELQEKIDAKKREIARLVENQRRFREDADFVEAIARQNNRIFPGELIFVFESE
jgi:cell division protein FtsB